MKHILITDLGLFILLLAIRLKAGLNFLAIFAVPASFGMTLPDLDKPSSDYRYGFQGQEKDDELKGEGNSLNYTFRMHDPRVGRFFSTDPLEPKYPWYTPYQFSGNRLIDMVELEGLEPTTAGNKSGDTYSDPNNGNNYEWDGKDWHSDMAGGIQANEVIVTGDKISSPGFSFSDFGRYLEGFLDRFLGHDPNRPRGSQGYTLDTFRTHTPEDIQTNIEQSAFGVDPYRTGDPDYDAGANLFDATIESAEYATIPKG